MSSIWDPETGQTYTFDGMDDLNREELLRQLRERQGNLDSPGPKISAQPPSTWDNFKSGFVDAVNKSPIKKGMDFIDQPLPGQREFGEMSATGADLPGPAGYLTKALRGAGRIKGSLSAAIPAAVDAFQTDEIKDSILADERLSDAERQLKLYQHERSPMKAVGEGLLAGAVTTQRPDVKEDVEANLARHTGDVAEIPTAVDMASIALLPWSGGMSGSGRIASGLNKLSRGVDAVDAAIGVKNIIADDQPIMGTIRLLGGAAGAFSGPLKAVDEIPGVGMADEIVDFSKVADDVPAPGSELRAAELESKGSKIGLDETELAELDALEQTVPDTSVDNVLDISATEVSGPGRQVEEFKLDPEGRPYDPMDEPDPNDLGFQDLIDSEIATRQKNVLPQPFARVSELGDGRYGLIENETGDVLNVFDGPGAREAAEAAARPNIIDTTATDVTPVTKQLDTGNQGIAEGPFNVPEGLETVQPVNSADEGIKSPLDNDFEGFDTRDINDPSVPQLTEVYREPENQFNEFSRNIVEELQTQLKESGTLGLTTTPTEKTALTSATVGKRLASPGSAGSITTAESVSEWLGKGTKNLSNLAPLNEIALNPASIAARANTPNEFVHEWLSVIAHELAHTSDVGSQHAKISGKYVDNLDVDAIPNTNTWPDRMRGRSVSDMTPEAQSVGPGDFSQQIRMDGIRDRLYQTPLIQNLLETSDLPDSPVSKLFNDLKVKSNLDESITQRPDRTFGALDEDPPGDVPSVKPERDPFKVLEGHSGVNPPDYEPSIIFREWMATNGYEIKAYGTKGREAWFKDGKRIIEADRQMLRAQWDMERGEFNLRQSIQGQTEGAAEFNTPKTIDNIIDIEAKVVDDPAGMEDMGRIGDELSDELEPNPEFLQQADEGLEYTDESGNVFTREMDAEDIAVRQEEARLAYEAEKGALTRQAGEVEAAKAEAAEQQLNFRDWVDKNKIDLSSGAKKNRARKDYNAYTSGEVQDLPPGTPPRSRKRKPGIPYQPISLINKAGRRSLENIKRAAPIAGERLDLFRNTWDQKKAAWIHEFRELRKQIPDESEEDVIRFLDGEEVSLAEPDLKSALKIRRLLRSIAAEAKANDVLVGERAAYFPHYFEKGGRRAGNVKGTKFKSSRGKVEPHIEMGRKSKRKDWVRRLDVLENYADSTSRRVAEAAVLGKKHEKLAREFAKYDNVTDTVWLKRSIRQITSGAEARTATAIESKARLGAAWLDLPLAAAYQPAQVAATIASGGLRNSMKASFKLLFNRNFNKLMKAEAARTGSTLPDVIQEMAGNIKDNKSWLKGKLWGIPTLDKVRRVHAHTVGEMVLSQAQAGNKGSRKLLDALGFKGIEAKALDGSTVGRKMSDTTQFRTGPAEKPLWASETGLGRFAWQYQHFAYQWGIYVKELYKNQGFRGITKLAIAGGIAGELAGNVRAGVKGHDIFNDKELAEYDMNDPEGYLKAITMRSKRFPLSHPIHRFLQNISMIGGAGIFFERGLGMILWPDEIQDVFTPPAARRPVNLGIAAVKSLKSGDVEPLQKEGIRQIPGIGFSAWADEMMPDNSTNRKRPNRPSRKRPHR